MRWIMLLTVLCCSACGSSSTSSGSRSDPGEPPEIGVLAKEDQKFVRRWVSSYRWGPREGTWTASGIVELGPKYRGGDAVYRAAYLVHSACHAKYKHKRNPQCYLDERLCNGYSVAALERIDQPDAAAYWQNDLGLHCLR